MTKPTTHNSAPACGCATSCRCRTRLRCVCHDYHALLALALWDYGRTLRRRQNLR